MTVVHPRCRDGTGKYITEGIERIVGIGRHPRALAETDMRIAVRVDETGRNGYGCSNTDPVFGDIGIGYRQSAPEMANGGKKHFRRADAYATGVVPVEKKGFAAQEYAQIERTPPAVDVRLFVPTKTNASVAAVLAMATAAPTLELF